MKSDADIKRDVEQELIWDPDIRSDDIAVAVKQGVVTLAGFVRSYSEKFEAERDATRVSGVLGVANDLEVRLPGADQRPDPEIAREAVTAIKSQLPYSYERITPVVNNAWITLEGEVEWNYQRELAETAVRRLKGVKGITNLIHVRPHAPAPSDVKKKIEEALKRSAELDANQITVETNGSEVILKGKVHSWAEKREAERAAWAAPGVTRVDNRLNVELFAMA
jgi:osmotically-inducible protein OsmY